MNLYYAGQKSGFYEGSAAEIPLSQVLGKIGHDVYSMIGACVGDIAIASLQKQRSYY
jgi:hypothetical protein